MDDRIDLSSLDPEGAGPRFDRLVTGIVTDAMAARSSRPQAVVPILLLTRWRGPLLAAAATIALVAGGSLIARPAPSPAPQSVVEAVGIPASVARWAERGEVPSVGELIAGVTAGTPGPGR